MFNKSYFIFLFALSLLGACSKKLPLSDLSFTASAARASFSVSDTAIFQFGGNPDFISFYSGEVGHRYIYRNRLSADGKPILTFTTARANGNQANSLTVLVASDFKITQGDTTATLAAIAGSKWTDITSRATLSTGSTTASGNVDLSDFAQAGKPVYIAFRHNGYKGSIYSKWTVSNIAVTNYLPDNTSYLIANLAANNTAILNYGVTTYSPGWVAYTVSNTYHWVISAGTSLLITGATTAAAATNDSENWAILGPLDLKKVTPDAGVPIKMISESMGKFPYLYQYLTPGKYQATFVASNVNSDRQDSIVRTIDLGVQ